MSRVVIAGGGFAGVSALKTLSKAPTEIRDDLEILLVDKKQYFEFLPMLPDVAGGWLGPDRIRCGLERITESKGAKFVHDEIKELDLKGRTIRTSGQEINYDHLIISTGSETNFFGDQSLQSECHRIDTVEDAISVRQAALERGKKGDVNVVVIGGGYTGIETASNLDVLLKKNNIKHKIYIIERARDLVLMLPEWMRNEVKREVSVMDIETRCDESLKSYDGSTAVLASGEEIHDALCVWTAGVKTSGFVDNLGFRKERTRIAVDKNLRPVDPAIESVFVAGDSASFARNKDNKPLRMAVMFSLAQGKIAASNIIRSIKGLPLEDYRPLDLGYLIPVANGKAPGIVMGAKIHGSLGYLMHYFMCVYRSEPDKMAGILKDLFSKILYKDEGGK